MKNILVLAFIALAFASCSKDNNSEDISTIEEGTFPIKEVYTEGKKRTEFFYERKDGKIVKMNLIEFDDYINNPNSYKKTESTMTYEGDYPVKEVRIDLINQKVLSETTMNYTSGKLTLEKETNFAYDYKGETSYTYDGDRLKKEINVRSYKNSTQYEDSEYEYVSPTQIKVTKIEYSKRITSGIEEESERRVYYYTYTLDTEGRLVERRLEDKYGVRVTKYTYDDKNNPKYQKVIKVMNPTYFTETSFAKNNLLTRTYSQATKDDNGKIKEWSKEEVERKEYLYNDKGYPIQEKLYNKENKLIHTIDYTY